MIAPFSLLPKRSTARGRSWTALHGLFFLGLGLVLLFAWQAGESPAGELRPYELPSVRPGANRPEQQRAPQQPSVDESVYRDFTQQVRTLSPAEKRGLAESFSRKLNEAVAKDRWEEAKHYNRLLEILRSQR